MTPETVGSAGQDRIPTTAASIPYEGTDCTADEAVESVKAVRATAASAVAGVMPDPARSVRRD